MEAKIPCSKKKLWIIGKPSAASFLAAVAGLNFLNTANSAVGTLTPAAYAALTPVGKFIVRAL